MGQIGLNTIDLLLRPCPLCGGGTAFTKWRFELLRCKRCGLVVDEAVWRPAANEEMEGTFFGEAYEPVQSFWVRLFEDWNNRRTMNRLRRQARLMGNLLDIGVGSGSFLAYAKAHGFVATGCDLSLPMSRRAEQTTGIKVHCGPLESMPDQPQFDVVVMNHVLEHVSNPRSLLKAALARLKPGGILHLAVPNFAAWEARLPGWNSYEPYHLLYFTPLTLRALAENSGFEVLEVKTHESFSGWFLALLRTALRKERRPAFQGLQGAANAGTKQSAFILEHGYRLAMVASGLATLPLRRLQELLGRGDEVILLARNGSDGW